MTYRYETEIANLYRILGNPWLPAKKVAKQTDQTMELTSTKLSRYVGFGAMETRYQRPRTEYRFVDGALDKPDRYREQQRERRARAAASFVYELERAGYQDAARYLQERYGDL